MWSGQKQSTHRSLSAADGETWCAQRWNVLCWTHKSIFTHLYHHKFPHPYSTSVHHLHVDYCFLLAADAEDFWRICAFGLGQLSGLLRDSKTALHWWNELIKNGSPSPSSRCTLIVALCRANALPEALQALQEMSHVLSDNRPFHLLPGKKRRPSTVEASDLLPVSLAVGNKVSPLEVEMDMPRGDGQTSKVEVEEEEEEEERDGDSGSQNDGHNIKKNVEGFHHWEVRKEMQDAYNALINAAGQAGKYKLAESLFSEVLNLGLPFPLKDLLITAAIWRNLLNASFHRQSCVWEDQGASFLHVADT